MGKEFFFFSAVLLYGLWFMLKMSDDGLRSTEGGSQIRSREPSPIVSQASTTKGGQSVRPKSRNTNESTRVCRAKKRSNSQNLVQRKVNEAEKS